MLADKHRYLGLIIQPGALGDCVLTLPLARLMKRQLGVRQVDVIGHRRYLDALVGRSDFSRVFGIDSLPLHRLFGECAALDLPEGDTLIELFRPYDFIVTFLGDADGSFEQNLIHVSAMTHGAEVISLQLRPAQSAQQDGCWHVSELFIRQFAAELPEMHFAVPSDIAKVPLIWPTNEDKIVGRTILEAVGVAGERVLAVHPGSGGVAKCWPLERYLYVLQRLDEIDAKAVAILGPTELERWSHNDTAKLQSCCPVLRDLSIEQLLGVLSCCDGYLGNDSGVSHLAGALALPAVSIFGPTDHRLWCPLGEQSQVCKSDIAGNWPGTQDVLDALRSVLS